MAATKRHPSPTPPASNVLQLIFRNIARIAAVTGVTGFLSFIGKITVILGTGGSFYYTMNREWPHLVNSLVVPTVLVMFIATGVAIMFFEVFGMGTTVLLQCYIADEEMFKVRAGVWGVRGEGVRAGGGACW